MAKKAKRSMAGLLLAASVALTATAAGNPSAAILRLLNSRSSGSPRDFAEAAEEVAAQAKEGKSVYAFVLGLISREPDAPPAAKLDAETQKRYLDENRPKIKRIAEERKNAMALYLMALDSGDTNDLHRAVERFVTHRGEIEAAAFRLRKREVLRPHQQHQPFQPHGKAECWRMRAADFFHKAVVAAAAADGALGADLGGNKFEDGTSVIIEAADDGRVYRERNPHGAQEGLYLFKVGAAVVAQIIEHLGRVLRDRGADGAFAVENAHRVAVEPLLTRPAELILAALKVIMQRLVILLAAVLAADRIELQLEIVHAEEREQLVREGDRLGVCRGRRRAEAFDAELMELAQAARLRLLVAVAARQIAKLLRHRLIIQAVLEEGAHNARRPLGAQRDRAVALVEKGVHLFLDDVGRIADAALEQLGVFKHRRPDLTEAVVAGDLERRTFQKLDLVALLRQHVLCALDGFGDQRHRLKPPLRKNGEICNSEFGMRNSELKGAAQSAMRQSGGKNVRNNCRFGGYNLQRPSGEPFTAAGNRHKANRT